MTTSLTQQTTLELDEQYLENKSAILLLETKLKQHLEELVLPHTDLAFALDFVQDHVTLFRFLKDSEFDETVAFERLLDTILWRKEINMDQIKWDTIHSSFFNHDHPAFAFFHKQDRFGRPVAVIRMRHFPDFGGLALSDTIPPFACLVMEIARKWTRDLTRRNEQQRLKDIDNNSKFDQSAPVLISQIAVVIDISKSPMVPLEKRLIQELRNVTDDRFPGFFGSIYVMNFGWMYQGLWQMVKLLLSERAKSKINFPSAKEVIEYIPEENLLQELGGMDEYEWTLDSDNILREYGSGWKMETQPAPSLSPPSSPTLCDKSPITRPIRSLSLSSFSSDDFYDALELPLNDQHQRQQSQSIWNMPSGYSSVYGTPGTLTPIGIRSPSTQPSPANRSLFPAPQPSTNRYFHLTGIHIPTFLATMFGSGPTFTAPKSSMDGASDGVCGVDLTYRLTNLALERQDESLDNAEALVVVEKQQQKMGQLQPHRREPHFPHLLPADDPHSAYAGAPLKLQIRRSEQRLVRITRRLFRLSFAYNGTLYWVILYIFLRGPAENSMKRLLAKMITDPRTMTYTTVGLTASLAGVLGASLSSSLGQ